jgi:flagellar biosynthetic protein FlhB
VSGFSLTKEQIFQPDVLVTRIMADLLQVVIAFAPLFAAVMVVAVCSPLVIGGWLMSGKAVTPNFSRLNPLKGLLNMVSMRALVELLKSIAKTLLVGGIAYLVMRSQKDAVIALALESVASGSEHLVQLLLTAFLMIVGGLGIIALIDGPYQVWHYADKLKMTRQEVIQESKESDGNPQVKGRIRSLQREMARRRMMAAVPTADVVVTNPTHYAVALKYSEGKMRAPQVVAKGADDVAAKIRELALENKVAILEAPPLARALYKHAEIGDEIPQALYTAVAEVLAYVFQLRAWGKTGGNKPVQPKELDVPPQLDPLNPASQTQPTPPG